MVTVCFSESWYISTTAHSVKTQDNIVHVFYEENFKERELITLDMKLDLEDLVKMWDDFIWIKFISNGRFS
jgi:hypothetical protein